MFKKPFYQGLNYLATEQGKKGDFLTLSSTHEADFRNASPIHTTFLTSLILICLSHLESTPLLESIKQKSLQFLLSQKSKNWSFNYWVKNSQEAKNKPYPDDFDDTCCALAGLYLSHPSLIDGGVMANVVSLLTTLEEKEGGPYYTWLTHKNADKIWKDIDIAVNSNIAYFLSLQKITLPNLVSFVESCIERKQLASPYYPSVYPTIYFISRFYQGSKKRELITLLFSQRRKNMSWGNPLSTALAISSLLNLGIASAEVSKSVDYLLQEQKDGVWAPYAFWLDHRKGEKKNYAGSAALTTACCLEALQKYIQVKNMSGIAHKQKKEITEKQIFYQKIVKKSHLRFSHLNCELQKEARNQLETILTKDKGQQIPLLPYYFRLSLGTHGKTIPNDLLIKLGVASVLGWVAYTIYDNFVDEEADPKTLFVANISLRELTVIFRGILPSRPAFQKLFLDIMDDLDSATAWEVAHCRVSVRNKKIMLKNYILPDYGNYDKIASKSLGHALGPLALLCSLGFSLKSAEIKNLLGFFKHYLIARQLNDDAHDWEDDIKTGQISPVGVLLLRDWQNASDYNKGDALLTTFIPKLQEIFWYQTVHEVCKIVSKHISLARKALYATQIIERPEVFEKFLLPLEIAMQQAVKQTNDAVTFLQVYKG